MKLRLVSALLAVLLATLCASTALARTTGNFGLIGGLKMLDDDDWKGVEDQNFMGAQIDLQPDGWPVSLAGAFLVSWDDNRGTDAKGFETEYTGTTAELDLGARYVAHLGTLLRPYIGGGLALVWAEQEYETQKDKFTDDGYGAGYWVGAGTYVLMGMFHVGIDVTYTWAEVDLDETVNAGGTRVGLLLGLSF